MGVFDGIFNQVDNNLFDQSEVKFRREHRLQISANLNAFFSSKGAQSRQCFFDHFIDISYFFVDFKITRLNAQNFQDRLDISIELVTKSS
ncbi:hypothetical protein D3C87_1533050 [compost metagenome]